MNITTQLAIHGPNKRLVNSPLFFADDNFLIVFSGQIRAFGVWVVNNNMKAVIPTFTALDAGGGTIETVQFAGAAIDGTIGGIADYGFLGIVSATPIASVRMVKDATIFDDLRFSDAAGLGRAGPASPQTPVGWPPDKLTLDVGPPSRVY